LQLLADKTVFAGEGKLVPSAHPRTGDGASARLIPEKQRAGRSRQLVWSLTLPR
jgi:hypothetical protein